MSTGARLVLVGWTLFGLTAVLREALLAYVLGRPVGGFRLWIPMIGALVWAALTPLAAWFVAVFPLAPGRKVRGVVALLLAGPLLVVAAYSLSQPLIALLRPQAFEPLQVLSNLSRVLRDNFVRGLTVAWSLLAILHAVATARRQQAAALQAARLEAEVAEHQLATARSEVDSAFLLGTLDALGPMIRRDGRAAEEVIVQLGDLLRRAYAGDDGSGRTREEIAAEIQRLSAPGLRPHPGPAASEGPNGDQRDRR